MASDRSGKLTSGQVIATRIAVPRRPILHLVELAGRSHLGRSACSPSLEKRLRQSHSRQVASLGNSLMDSITEYVDSYVWRISAYCD